MLPTTHVIENPGRKSITILGPELQNLDIELLTFRTFLATRKVLENWWYWLVIDSASVIIYWLRDLQLTSLLFVAYVIMIPFGIVSWTRSFREQRA